MRYQVQITKAETDNRVLSVVISASDLSLLVQRNFDQLVHMGDRVELIAVPESTKLTELKVPRNGTIEVAAEGAIIDGHEATVLQLTATATCIICSCGISITSYSFKTAKSTLQRKHWAAKTAQSKPTAGIAGGNPGMLRELNKADKI